MLRSLMAVVACFTDEDIKLTSLLDEALDSAWYVARSCVCMCVCVCVLRVQCVCVCVCVCCVHNVCVCVCVCVCVRVYSVCVGGCDVWCNVHIRVCVCA